MNMINRVRDWMQAFLQDIPCKPKIPSRDIRKLRYKLIVEEASELRNSVTLVEALDAIADLRVVVEGAAVAYGFTQKQVDLAFAEVMSTNWQKLWTLAEVEHYEATHECDGYLKFYLSSSSNDTRPLFVAKDPSGKIIKPPNWQKPNLNPILKLK